MKSTGSAEAISLVQLKRDFWDVDMMRRDEIDGIC